MTDAVPQRLSRDEILALKYAAHRQLARWAKARPLHPASASVERRLWLPCGHSKIQHSARGASSAHLAMADPAPVGRSRYGREVALDLTVHGALEAHEQFLVEHSRDALERCEAWRVGAALEPRDRRVRRAGGRRDFLLRQPEFEAPFAQMGGDRVRLAQFADARVLARAFGASDAMPGALDAMPGASTDPDRVVGVPSVAGQGQAEQEEQ